VRVIIEVEGTGSDQKGVAVIQNWPAQGGLLSARATNNRPGNCADTLHTLVVRHKKTPTL